MSGEIQTENKSKPISQFMSKIILGMNADSTVLELAKAMSAKKVSSIILIDNNGNEIGIVTERDLTREICAKDVVASKKSARSIMSSGLLTIDGASSVENAAELMVKNGTRHLLVEQKNNIYDTSSNRRKIVGLVTTTDIAKYLREKLQQTITSDSDERLWEALYLADGGDYDEQCQRL